MTDPSPLDYPPPGITQREWADMSTSERAAALYNGEPMSWAHDDDVQRLRERP
ncbi:hypothetical protein [Actinacidiphila sp. bgisy160]|uniref:hypothetical protein n=1 Tax=Actinacidiphila sp. bgisy160 TaxID=3413796 RepID=UPI003D744A69